MLQGLFYYGYVLEKLLKKIGKYRVNKKPLKSKILRAFVLSLAQRRKRDLLSISNRLILLVLTILKILGSRFCIDK